jgi:hypothetical protein
MPRGFHHLLVDGAKIILEGARGLSSLTNKTRKFRFLKWGTSRIFRSRPAMANPGPSDQGDPTLCHMQGSQGFTRIRK